MSKIKRSSWAAAALASTAIIASARADVIFVSFTVTPSQIEAGGSSTVDLVLSLSPDAGYGFARWDGADSLVAPGTQRRLARRRHVQARPTSSIAGSGAPGKSTSGAPPPAKLRRFPAISIRRWITTAFSRFG